MSSDIKSLTTNGVNISVETNYLPDQSSSMHKHFTFAYRITITNHTEYTIQLLRRKWDIVDALGQKREVKGEGVVGQQPILSPGESHTYVSGCTFQTPIGKMEGQYEMLRLLDNQEFIVRIPEFLLMVPVFQN